MSSNRFNICRICVAVMKIYVDTLRKAFSRISEMVPFLLTG